MLHAPKDTLLAARSRHSPHARERGTKPVWVNSGHSSVSAAAEEGEGLPTHAARKSYNNRDALQTVAHPLQTSSDAHCSEARGQCPLIEATFL